MLLCFLKLKGIYLGGVILPTVKLIDLGLVLKVKITPGALPPAFYLGEVEVNFLSKVKPAFICNLKLNYSLKMTIFSFQIINIPLDTNCSKYLKLQLFSEFPLL